MRLNDRLRKIYEQVKPGESVADIGTDHGYVPLMLRINNISPSVIMSDISSGSLKKAEINFETAGFIDNAADFRLGDGLNKIAAYEVDDIIIAGMGGILISSIIGSDMDKSKSYKKYILQPRNNSGKLRYFLYTNGFEIKKEILVKEGKFICEIIVAVPTSTDKTADIPNEEDIRWKYPKSMAECDKMLLNKKIKRKIESIDKRISDLHLSKDSYAETIQILGNDRRYLEEFIDTAEKDT